METKMETMSYIARCRCGAILYAALDIPYNRDELARDISKLIKGGYAIERISTREARADPKFFTDCTCGR